MVLMDRRAHKKIARKMVLILALIAWATGGVRVGLASALTYQQDIGVNFTFNSTLQLTLSSADYNMSSADLVISDLVPGTAADSNIITAKVVTNNVNGYTLNATVGNDAYYDTRNLVSRDANQNTNFASVAYGSSIANKDNLTDDTWAYSFSLDAGSTWSDYSGLPLYSDTTNVATLKTSNGPVASTSGDQVQFKIAAKAATTQKAGEYNNVINFNLVAVPVPTTLFMAYTDAGKTQLNGYYKMQDMNADICSAVETEDEGLQVIDVRDNKVYWIAKLRDGNCWMTQNLDLDLDAGRTYTNFDTDIGYNTATGQYETAAWQPLRSTYPTSTTNTGTWCNGGVYRPGDCENFTPESYDPGNLYWNGVFSDGSDWFAYSRSCDRSTIPPVCNEALNPITTYTTVSGSPLSQYHLGNYYNWTAAIAMNDASAYAEEENELIEQSICPAGWTLPRIGTGDDTFYALWSEYGYDEEDDGASYVDDLLGAPIYFLVNGYWWGYFSGIGDFGVSWSPVFAGFGDGGVAAASITEGYASPSMSDNASLGYPVRCIARPVAASIVPAAAI